MPDAFFACWIRMRIIRAQDLAVRSSNFMFAATFFTIVSIFVKCESVIASANVRADSIATFLLAAAVVHCTFIFVYSHIKNNY
jgi:hypothetical protein